MSKEAEQSTHQGEFAAQDVAGITIAIPNWNHEFYLPRVIRSALQAAKHLADIELDCEILVVDDYSRDGSLALLRQLEALYYERGLRVLTSRTHGGAVAARNTAIKRAKYRFILFVDADNELIPENVPLFVRAIAETKAAVVYGNLLVHHQGIGLTGLISNEVVQPRLFGSNYIDTCALYDRDQLREVSGFYETGKMKAHEDWELFLHLVAVGRKIVFVPVTMGLYHFRPASHVSEAIQDEDIEERALYVKRVYDQQGIRSMQRFNAKHLRYHPDVGYL